jgi:hypothetical protein
MASRRDGPRPASRRHFIDIESSTPFKNTTLLLLIPTMTESLGIIQRLDTYLRRGPICFRHAGNPVLALQPASPPITSPSTGSRTSLYCHRYHYPLSPRFKAFIFASPSSCLHYKIFLEHCILAHVDFAIRYCSFDRTTILGFLTSGA